MQGFARAVVSGFWAFPAVSNSVRSADDLSDLKDLTDVVTR